MKVAVPRFTSIRVDEPDRAAFAWLIALDPHRRVVEEDDFTVESIAAKIHKSSAPLIHPGLDALIHLFGPVFGMDGDHQHFVSVEIEHAGMQLVLAVEVVVESLLLQP